MRNVINPPEPNMVARFFNIFLGGYIPGLWILMKLYTILRNNTVLRAKKPKIIPSILLEPPPSPHLLSYFYALEEKDMNRLVSICSKREKENTY